MQNLLTLICDVIFPPSDDMRFVRSLSKAHMHTLFRISQYKEVIALSSFEQKSIQSLIHEAKFHGSTKAFELLACLLDTYLSSHMEEFDVVIPIPLSPQRKRERGFNQVQEILRLTKHKVAVDTKSLIRTKNTRPQTSLSKEDRLKNLHDAFFVKKPSRILGKRILLIDDVTTTGATMLTAKASLLPHSPASVTCLALAH